jgi:predicted Zn-ribbon and HTH transcriptional regulator
MILGELSFWTMVRIWLLGSAFHHWESRGKGRLKIETARCRLHGYFMDYRHGWHRELRCPKCMKLRFRRFEVES